MAFSRSIRTRRLAISRTPIIARGPGPRSRPVCSDPPTRFVGFGWVEPTARRPSVEADIVVLIRWNDKLYQLRSDFARPWPLVPPSQLGGLFLRLESGCRGRLAGIRPRRPRRPSERPADHETPALSPRRRGDRPRSVACRIGAVDG